NGFDATSSTESPMCERAAPGVLFSTASMLTSGIRSHRPQLFRMPPQNIPRRETPPAPRWVGDGSAEESLSAVNKRLADAEHQLEIQFTRLAQLQVQLDLVLAAFRRLSE